MEIQVDSHREENGILKSQLAEAEKCLQEKLDLFISQSPSLGMASQIHKSTHYENSETWDEDVWDYSGENFIASSEIFPDSFPFWLLIKTEVTNEVYEVTNGSAYNSLMSCRTG